MPNPGSSEVGQRRFWNALADQPGVIFIGSWGSLVNANLWASDDGGSWMLVYTGAQLDTGVLPFPVRYKLCRYWKMTYENYGGAYSSTDWNGTNEWIFKPYSSDMHLAGPSWWARGDDWETANLFYDSSPYSIPTSIHYTAALQGAPIEGGYFEPYASGFGAGGLLYGYLNNHYFGNNEMGGDKPSEGVGPKKTAVGDLSKVFGGFWGAFGISHGVAPGGYSIKAEWVFDLCDRPAMAATSASLSLGNQGEGWGTDAVKVTTSEGRRQFILDVTPARGTLNVYTPQGERLFEGVHYIPQDCDRSGRYYWLLYEPTDPCNKVYHLVVTYLVLAATLRQGKRTSRLVDTNEGHDRLRNLDIRGFS